MLENIKKAIILIFITITIYLGFWYYGNHTTVIHKYQKDSVFYRQKDSIHNIMDTTEIKIKEIHKTYEKKVEIINHLPIDSAYIFWANYIQRYHISNDSTPIESN